MDVSLRRDKDSLQGTGETLVDFQKGRDTNWFLYQGSLENSAKECASTDAETNGVLKKCVKSANIGIRNHTKAGKFQTIFRCELPFQTYD